MVLSGTSHRPQRARRARAHRDPQPMGPDAEAAYHPLVRAPWGRPRRTASPALSPYSTCSHPPRRPPNGDTAIRAPRRPWTPIGCHATALPMPRPTCDDARDPLIKAGLSIKAGRSSPRASTEPLPSAIGAPAVNSVLRPIPHHFKLRTSSLGLPRAATGTSCPAFPFPSPEFEQPRQRRPCFAVAACRRCLRSPKHMNRSLVS
jgi:hypothetical protein